MKRSALSAAAAMLCVLAGCRQYSVTKAPDGSVTVDVMIVGSDVQVGTINYTKADGTAFEVSDLTAEARALATVEKLVDRIP